MYVPRLVTVWEPCGLPVNSSHGHLVTQSTRHKQAHNKAISRNFFPVHAGQVAARNSPQHGRRTYGK